MLLGAHQPQMIGAPALHEAQIIGVIDDAGKIRIFVVDADLHVMAAVADLAVESGVVTCGPSIARRHRFAQIRRARKRGYDTAGPAPSVTSTISGGTPRRNGMMLQPRPPETMTSQLILAWP